MSEQDGPVEVALDVSAVPERPAGAGRYIVELARALAKRPDCGLVLLSRRDDAMRWDNLVGGQRVLAVSPERRVSRLLYEQTRLGSVVAAVKSPTVTVHHGPHYTMPRRSRVPCVVTVHDMTFFDHPEWHEPSKVWWFRAATRYSVRHAAVIVCVSETTATRLREVLSPRCVVLTVPNGVDLERFVADEPTPGVDRAALDRLGVGRPYVLHLGTLEPRKGVEDLVSAFDLLSSGHEGLELVLAGGVGWKAQAALDAIARARAGARIRRLGYVGDEDVPALLRNASVVAYPSLEEGFGLPALEALACGSPLVTTSGTSMAELAGDAALLVPPGQPRSLAEAIETAIGDRALKRGAERRALGLEVAARYTWEACAEGHMGAYRLANRS